MAWFSTLAQAAPMAMVLGVAQDAGHPQAGCTLPCCRDLNVGEGHLPCSLALVDPDTNQRWMIDVTPAFPEQLRALQVVSGGCGGAPDGLLLTHAHVGHYSGLFHLGREVMGAKRVPVWAMPRMRVFLQSNEPWAHLITHGHVVLRDLVDHLPIQLSPRLSVTPIVVPHRDEFSETVGFHIRGPSRSVLYVTDVDRWSGWGQDLTRLLEGVEVAYLDGTFFSRHEVPGRDLQSIPHPFVEDSLAHFEGLPLHIKGRIRFIHLNHTNPLLRLDSEETKRVEEAGFGVARVAERVAL